MIDFSRKTESKGRLVVIHLAEPKRPKKKWWESRAVIFILWATPMTLGWWAIAKLVREMISP